LKCNFYGRCGYLPCDAWRRENGFRPDILEVRYKEKNIHDVLEMTVKDAIDFFASQEEAGQQNALHRN